MERYYGPSNGMLKESAPRIPPVGKPWKLQRLEHDLLSLDVSFVFPHQKVGTCSITAQFVLSKNRW